MKLIGAEVTYDEHNGSYVAYRLEVTPKHGSAWCVARRYKEFVDLREELMKMEPMIEELPFPQKTVFGGMSNETVNERVEMLGRFCKYAIKMVRQGALVTFLRNDGSDNSVADLLLVQRYMKINNRDSTDNSIITLDRTLSGFGFRPMSEKNAFLLSCRRTGPQVVTVYSLPPNCQLDLKSKSKGGHFRSFVMDAQHPFVLPPGELTYFRRKNKMMVSRDYGSRGSLRDFIHRSSPTDPYHDKYARRGQALGERQIAILGRQILEGLSFLKACGLRCTHMHCGNILMLGTEWCRFLCLPSLFAFSDEET